jgi:hypothetical protein
LAEKTCGRPQKPQSEAVKPSRPGTHPLASSPSPHAIAAGCDHGADEHSKRDAKEDFAAYH